MNFQTNTQIQNTPRSPDSTKNSQSYSSYFYRSKNDNSKISPSKQQLHKKQSRTKSRIKQSVLHLNNMTRASTQLENSSKIKKNQVEVLKQQNIQLKNVISQLKLKIFYKIDEEKVKELILELDLLRSQIARLQKINEKLKIENDFYQRTNQQLKNQITKIYENHQRSSVQKLRNQIKSPSKFLDSKNIQQYQQLKLKNTIISNFANEYQTNYIHIHSNNTKPYINTVTNSKNKRQKEPATPKLSSGSKKQTHQRIQDYLQNSKESYLNDRKNNNELMHSKSEKYFNTLGMSYRSNYGK